MIGKRKLRTLEWRIHGLSICTRCTLQWVRQVMMQRQSKSTQAGQVLCLILLIDSLLPSETLHSLVVVSLLLISFFCISLLFNYPYQLWFEQKIIIIHISHVSKYLPQLTKAHAQALAHETI